jgi:hypothetical protein
MHHPRLEEALPEDPEDGVHGLNHPPNTSSIRWRDRKQAFRSVTCSVSQVAGNVGRLVCFMDKLGSIKTALNINYLEARQ